MTRRHFTFGCEGSSLAATLDVASGSTGLLIVTGGNEVRSGAWNGQARFAAQIAAVGYPVLRFDRRGVGDSEGGNGGFRSSAADITAARAAFRQECPQVTRVVAWGNCDAASALMLAGGTGCDGLVLSNPWTIEDTAAEPAPAVLRDHYRKRLADPAAIKRLLTGKVSLGKLAASLLGAAKPVPSAPPLTGLVGEMAAGIEGFAGPVRFLIAERDRTAQAFLAAWPKDDPRVWRCADATHSFVEPHPRQWLAERLLDALKA